VIVTLGAAGAELPRRGRVPRASLSRYAARPRDRGTHVRALRRFSRGPRRTRRFRDRFDIEYTTSSPAPQTRTRLEGTAATHGRVRLPHHDLHRPQRQVRKIHAGSRAGNGPATTRSRRRSSERWSRPSLQRAARTRWCRRLTAASGPLGDAGRSGASRCEGPHDPALK